MDARNGDPKCGACPAGHPRGQQWPHRRAAAQSRHARRHRLLADAPLPQGIPLRPARHRGAALEVVADPQPDHPDRAARAEGQGLRQDLEQGARRRAAQDHHARAGREARQPRSPTSASWSTGPCATPIRRPRSRHRALQREGCDRILLVPLYPQYAAATTATACDQAFRALMTMRWQPAVRVAPRLSRRSRLYRRARRRRCAATSPASISSPSAHRLLPRHAAALSRERRSLSLPVPEDLAPAARGARLAPESAGTPPSSRASATSRGCSPTPSRRWSGWRGRASSGSRSSRPGFSADCLETLEELDVENREFFLPTAARSSPTCPASTTARRACASSRTVVRRELMGWV